MTNVNRLQFFPAVANQKGDRPGGGHQEKWQEHNGKGGTFWPAAQRFLVVIQSTNPSTWSFERFTRLGFRTFLSHTSGGYGTERAH